VPTIEGFAPETEPAFFRLIPQRKREFLKNHGGFLTRVQEKLARQHCLYVAHSTVARYWRNEFTDWPRLPLITKVLDEEYRSLKAAEEYREQRRDGR
jgi:hypothetical protein